MGDLIHRGRVRAALVASSVLVAFVGVLAAHPAAVGATTGTTVTYTGPTSGDYHDAVAVSAKLASGTTGISGESLSFTLGSASCSNVTDSTGKAGCTLTVANAAGAATMTVHFAGDGAKGLNASSTSASFTIAKEQTTLTYTGATSGENGGPVALSGNLTEDGSAAISGRTVSFTVGTGASAQTCSGSTDFAGNANCSVTLAQSATATSLPVVAGFAGDTFYAAATDKGTIAIEYMTGRAYDVAATGLLPLGPIGDTGPVAVNGPKSVTPCVLPLVSPVSGGVLCSSVVTSTGPDTSKASASVASLAIGATGGLPDIAVKAVEADSSTTCSKTSGTTTIAYLKIGSTVVIVSPTAPAPNTVVTEGPIKIILNEQVKVAGADKGTTVNAVHIIVSGVEDIVISSATSDIHNCPPPVPQGSCEGSGSLSTLVAGKNVISYIPKGNWLGGPTGIDVVNVEGTSVTNTQIPTGSDVINSCASNSSTGQTVCTANNNHVYILKGTGLDPSVATNPLTDGGSGGICFTGGCATSSGVAMDATHNQALIGLSVALPSGGNTAGFQLLNLTNDTFGAPFATQSSGGRISEDPLIDPIRNLIASATESSSFELINVANPASPNFFEHSVSPRGELDSTAEDCATGILLAPAEFSGPSTVEVADINNPGSAPRAVFTPGTPGSWTAPEQVQSLTGSNLSAGASGVSVAQGTHTGIISGEFGGNGVTALALPTTSGAGAVPAISDWVTCSIGSSFSMGDDPHTLAAYASPNTGHAMALLEGNSATSLAVVDLTQMLTSVPSSGHVCTGGTLPAGAVTMITTP